MMTRTTIRLFSLRSHWLCLFLLAGTVLLSGCGGGAEAVPSGQVSGNVTFDGSPWTTGRINFASSTTGAGAYADLQEDGSFTLPAELPAGEYKVFFTPVGLGDQPPAEPGQPEPATTLEGLPEKYQSETTTDQTATVKEGDNSLSFSLTS